MFMGRVPRSKGHGEALKPVVLPMAAVAEAPVSGPVDLNPDRMAMPAGAVVPHPRQRALRPFQVRPVTVDHRGIRAELLPRDAPRPQLLRGVAGVPRSEEHTSELQSLRH